MDINQKISMAEQEVRLFEASLRLQKFIEEKEALRCKNGRLQTGHRFHRETKMPALDAIRKSTSGMNVRSWGVQELESSNIPVLSRH